MNVAKLISSRPVPDAAIRTPRVKTRRARVSRVKYLSHDTIELVVTADDANQAWYAQAGQFCTLSIPETRLTRAYSLARAPRAEHENEFTFIIRLIPDGEFSRWLRAGDRLGHVIYLSGPLGNFVLDDSELPIVCIAGGSGMSAMYALIEEAKIRQLPRDCYFFYGARTSADLYLTAEIQQLQRDWHRDFNLSFVAVLSEEPTHSNWTGPRGLVGEIAISMLAKIEKLNYQQAKYFLCGPPIMINTTVENLRQLGVPSQNCLFDKFEDANGPAPKIDNTRCVLCDECLLVKPTPDCIIESSNVAFDGAPPRVSPLKTAGLYYNALVVDDTRCIRCHACINACPHGAISVNYSTPTTTLRQHTKFD